MHDGCLYYDGVLLRVEEKYHSYGEKIQILDYAGLVFLTILSMVALHSLHQGKFTVYICGNVCL